MGFIKALKGALNPFSKSKLNPLNAPGLSKVAGVVGKSPGMKTVGKIPGVNKVSQVTPGMKGMFEDPKKKKKTGIGPSVSP